MRVGWICVFVALAGAGCGKVSNEAGAQSLDALCDERARAACDLLARCTPAELRSSVATCVREHAASCRAAQAGVRAAVLAGRAGVDEARLSACRRALATARCGARTEALDGDHCALVVSGRTGHGGRCWADYECEGRCDLATCPGICRAPSEGAALGEPCGAPNPCREGLRCDPAQGRCVGLKASGACTASIECAPGLACAAPEGGACGGANPCQCLACGADGQPCCEGSRCGVGLECTQGRCRAPGGEGEACSVRERRSCAASLVCVVSDPGALEGACGVPRAQGEPCWYGWECAKGLACRGAGTPQAPRGECGPPASAGDACRPATGYVTGDCAPGAYCSGACHDYAGAGAACGGGADECESGLWCIPEGGAAACGPLPSAGEPCLAPYFCADGTFCNPQRLCETLKSGGSPCASGHECATTICGADGRCQAPRGDGQECAGNLECASGECRMGTCARACTPG